jgi:hypothetical protein
MRPFFFEESRRMIKKIRIDIRFSGEPQLYLVLLESFFQPPVTFGGGHGAEFFLGDFLEAEAFFLGGFLEAEELRVFPEPIAGNGVNELFL